ncbi:hypothetical protein EV356DRAFT_531572 [Viridothelium virens]|uniref:L-type lectin-like domain-containing protein n=1 Tax=Viridothelium virens TaxID=1048519 RepID=A0A6A6HC88_VIRVR|nr:hypothetical protein EV356DRAFT_531572 [Viridothelium virens]
MVAAFLRSCLWLLASSIAVLAAEADDGHKRIHLRTHSLTSPYLDSDMQSRWWDFGADTVIRADQYVRLTADRPSQAGWIFSRVPLTATNWEIEVEFSIKGAHNLYGDGMAMWLTKQRGMSGQVFGHTDKFEGLGIFFDTYKNNRPGVTFPYIMAMMGDGQTEYEKHTDGKSNELDGCSARGIRNAHVPTKALVTYFADKNLTVALQYKNEDEWTPCFSIANVKIPSVAYLGFSAETGELSDNHDIISVETRNMYQPAGGSTDSGRGGNRGGSRRGRNGRNEGGGWGWFFVKVLLFVMAVGGSYVGYTMYRANQRPRY